MEMEGIMTPEVLHWHPDASLFDPNHFHPLHLLIYYYSKRVQDRFSTLYSL